MIAYWLAKSILSLSVFDNFSLNSDWTQSGVTFASVINAVNRIFDVDTFVNCIGVILAMLIAVAVTKLIMMIVGAIF